MGGGVLLIQLDVETREEEGWLEHVSYSHGAKYQPHLDYPNDLRSWEEAESHCQGDGGHLASVSTWWDQQEVWEATSGSSVWLGGSDREEEGSGSGLMALLGHSLTGMLGMGEQTQVVTVSS